MDSVSISTTTAVPVHTAALAAASVPLAAASVPLAALVAASIPLAALAAAAVPLAGLAASAAPLAALLLTLSLFQPLPLLGTFASVAVLPAAPLLSLSALLQLPVPTCPHATSLDAAVPLKDCFSFSFYVSLAVCITSIFNP